MTSDFLADGSQCDATIAICTYNRVATLKRTLQSLDHLRGRYSFEVIVVNGPSTDGTHEYLAGRDDLRLLDNPRPNLSVSRNMAIANAAGRYIAFIDDDAIPEPDWLEMMLDMLEAEPEISALGGFIRDANGIGFQAKYVYCDVFGRGYPCDDPEYATYLSREKRLYLSLTGTNVVFRRKDLLEVSGFDEAFAYFLDETDVNKRMHDRGMRLEMLPGAEVHHKYAPSHLRSGDQVAKNMYPIARSVAYFALVHGVPEVGWSATADRIRKFYRDEFGWKSDTVSSGRLNAEEFGALMLQSYRGVIDGIDLYFDEPAEPPERRVDTHRNPAPAIVRRCRDAGDTLRLCMFSQDHGHASPAGIGRWTGLAARGLAEKGHEVTVIGHTGPGHHQEFADFTEHGYWSHNISGFDTEARSEVNCLGLPDSVGKPARRKLTELRRIQPRRRFQVASSPIWDVEGAAVIAAGEIPTVLSLHTCAGLMLDSKPEWKANEDYYENHVLKVINAEIQALKRCDMILANSAAILRDISDIYGLDLMARPHRVVPHGIDDIEDADVLLDREVAADSVPRILFLGRLERRKGITDLVWVAERLLAEGKRFALDIVGGEVDAEHRDMVARLVARAGGQVVYHGFLDDAGIDALMRRADIFLAPSHYESFGLIYIEAMRYALPCIGYVTGGVAEVVSDGVDGLLSPMGDREGLCAQVLRLLENPDTRRTLARGARRSFLKRFHYRTMADALEEVYAGVARGR